MAHSDWKNTTGDDYTLKLGNKTSSIELTPISYNRYILGDYRDYPEDWRELDITEKEAKFLIELSKDEVLELIKKIFGQKDLGFIGNKYESNSP